ncbi:unnamed protein product [Prorocentrum cordatum]|uniref:Snurportin-1 n=1 Tax=Prorocentrum cordatum TaxID=2364126 RepID=A0ABN9UXE5_9DINO|nr:unnamed protein product [Polarella glacialis]
MATGRRPDVRLSGGQRRAPRERRQAQRWAALSRERLAQRQAAQLLELQGLAEAPPSILRRLALVAPVLIAQEKGEQLQEGRILERSVGCHAQDLPRPGAPRRAWRIAQRGPRLPRPRSLLSGSRDFPTGSAVSHVADVEAALLADSAARAAVRAESEGHVEPSEYVDTLRRDADLFWPLRPPGRWDDGGVVMSGTEEVGTGRTPLRSSAEPFLLSGSVSQRRSDEGVLCSCGAVLYSSCRAAAGIVGIVQADDVSPGGTAGRAPLPPATAADGGATADVPGASCDGSDVDDVTLDGEADADTSCSVGEPPGADHAGTAAAAAAYLAAFPQALFSGGGGGWGRCEVGAGDWWRARAVVARVWLTTGAATVQESGAAGSAAPPPPLPDDLLRAECQMSGRAAGAVAPPLLRRVRFADAPCVLDIGCCSGMRGILRRGSVPGFLDPAWTRQAKAVDLMHMIEGDSFGLTVPPMRRPHQLRARFADESRLVDALPPGMSVERARELDRLIKLCGGQ